MKLASLAASLVLLLCAASASAAPTGRICFVRSEGPGMPNPQPIHLWGHQGGKPKKLTDVKGAAKACARVAIGQWTLEARSARPSAKKSADQGECGSAPLTLDVAKDATVTVLVGPLGGGPTNMCGWELN